VNLRQPPGQYCEQAVGGVKSTAELTLSR